MHGALSGIIQNPKWRTVQDGGLAIRCQLAQYKYQMRVLAN